MDKYILIIIILDAFSTILAFILGLIVSSDEIGIAEHKGYLRGLKERKRREKKNEQIRNNEYTDDGK